MQSPVPPWHCPAGSRSHFRGSRHPRGPNRMGGRIRKKRTGPVLIHAFPVTGPLIAGRHPQHIPDRQPQQSFVRLFRQQILKKIRYRLVQGKLSLLRQHADRQSDHRFADGVHPMHLSFPERRVIGFCLFLPVYRQDESMQIHPVRGQTADKALNPVSQCSFHLFLLIFSGPLPVLSGTPSGKRPPHGGCGGLFPLDCFSERITSARPRNGHTAPGEPSAFRQSACFPASRCRCRNPLRGSWFR